jgi:hypothetical protein
MPSQPVVLYGANGDSIASADSFPELLQSAPSLVDSATDTSAMTVTFSEGAGIRSMTLKRALQDYLPDTDRAHVIATLKAKAQANNKLANWLTAQGNGPTGPTGSTGVTGATGVTGVTGATGPTGPLS